MKKYMFPLLMMALALASCSRAYYKTGSYDYFAGKHRLVAILPVQTITYGRMPERPTEEEIRAIEDAESRAFQVSLYTNITERTGNNYGNIQIDIQHYSETNARLKEAGISARDTWERSSTELAQILGVDAVVRTTVEKERYLTNLESFGVSVATTVVFLFSRYPWLGFFPNSRTSEVRASCAIVDGQNGVAVWATDKREPTYWNRAQQDAVNDITRSLARRFPYRD